MSEVMDEVNGRVQEAFVDGEAQGAKKSKILLAEKEFTINKQLASMYDTNTKIINYNYYYLLLLVILNNSK